MSTFFGILPSWIHDRFMWVVNKIFHAMSESKLVGIFWSIYVSTDTHDKLLNIIYSLNSDVHEATNPVVEGAPMIVFNSFFALIQFEVYP